MFLCWAKLSLYFLVLYFTSSEHALIHELGLTMPEVLFFFSSDGL